MKNTLTKEQLKIVKSTKKNVFVLATAGSGKTTTMIQTVKTKIENGDVKPSEIYMTSFTNSDVENTMGKLTDQHIPVGEKDYDDTFSDLSYASDDGVSVSTLHVLARTIARRIIALNNDKVTLTEHDSLMTYNQAFAQYIEEKDPKSASYFDQQTKTTSFPYSFLRGSICANTKNNDYFETILADTYNDVTRPLRREFNQFLLQQGHISINLDNTFVLARLLLEDPRYTIDASVFPKRLLIIDEAQDLSHEQLDFLKQLKERFDFQLYMVGDLRQCIYGWRDADPVYYNEWIHSVLEEEKDDSELLSLSHSFRLPNEASCRLPNAIFKQSPIYDPNIHCDTTTTRDEPVELDDNWDDMMLFHNDQRKQLAKDYNVFYLEPFEENQFDSVMSLARKLIYHDHVHPSEICIVANTNRVLEELEHHPYTYGKYPVPIGRRSLDVLLPKLKDSIHTIQGHLSLWYRAQHPKRYLRNRMDENAIRMELKRQYFKFNECLSEIERCPYTSNDCILPFDLEKKADYDALKQTFASLNQLRNRLFNLIFDEEETIERDTFLKLTDQLDHAKSAGVLSIFQNARSRDCVKTLTVQKIKGKEFEHVIYINNRTGRGKSPLLHPMDELEEKEVIDAINKMFVVLTRTSHRTYICPDCATVKQGVNAMKTPNTIQASRVGAGVMDTSCFAYDDLFHSKKMYHSYLDSVGQVFLPPYSIDEDFFGDEKETHQRSASSIVYRPFFYPVRSFEPTQLEGFTLKTTAQWRALSSMRFLACFYYDDVMSKRGEAHQMLDRLRQKCRADELGNVIESRTRYEITQTNRPTHPDGLARNEKQLIEDIARFSATLVLHGDSKSHLLERRAIETKDYTHLVDCVEADFLTEDSVVEMKCTRHQSIVHVLQALFYAIAEAHNDELKETIRLVYPLELLKAKRYPVIEFNYSQLPSEMLTFLEDDLLGLKTDSEIEWDVI